MKASPGLFLSEARDLQCFLGGSSVFRGLKKWGPFSSQVRSSRTL